MSVYQNTAMFIILFIQCQNIINAFSCVFAANQRSTVNRKFDNIPQYPKPLTMTYILA